MTFPIWQRFPPAGEQEGLAELAKEVASDLQRLNHPPANWVLPAKGPDGKLSLIHI